MGEISVRDARSLGDYQRLVEIQKEVWGMSDIEVVPVVELITVQHCGGLCMGAFDGDDMVGFVYGMVGCDEGRFCHHSHMLAVVPSHRGRGIGIKLKWSQRDRVLDQGMDVINWTFDPLQAPNAKLNIRHFGVTIKEYVENIYGETGSPLHGGIPTDRFKARWWLESRRVLQAREGRLAERTGWEALARINQTDLKSGFLHCEAALLDREENELLVEIPHNMARVMVEQPELAMDWRMKSRQLFQSYFSRGYSIVDFHREGKKAFYHLSRKAPR